MYALKQHYFNNFVCVYADVCYIVIYVSLFGRSHSRKGLVVDLNVNKN